MFFFLSKNIFVGSSSISPTLISTVFSLSFFKSMLLILLSFLMIYPVKNALITEVYCLF